MMTDEIIKPKPIQQTPPGQEHLMDPAPQFERENKFSARRLENKVAIITGGDSGIGRATAIAFAKEGADLAIFYLNEHNDADVTKTRVEELGSQCLCLYGDLGNHDLCFNLVDRVFKHFGHIDILINNCAEQHVHKNLDEIQPDELEKVFRTNIFSFFYMSQAVLKYLKKGGSIVNTTSITAYRGSADLLDYSSTKAAIVAFTHSLANKLMEKEIRVNAVAPGPIWTPLIPSTFSKEKIKKFGENVPMKRMGQPCEVAPSFVFLASEDASYMTGQVLHPNGGWPVH